MSFRSNQGFLAAVKATFPSIPACLSVCLPDCLPAADPPVYASISICLQSCRLTSLGSSVPMCDLRVQRKVFFAPALPAQLFLPQHFCVFAPVFLGHSLAVWVALALQNMPPKARAPEARMVFGWGQVCGVEICTCSGPSRCLPTVALLASCGLLAPDAWKCKRAQVSLKATIDAPMLGTITEHNGDGLLEDSHMPVGWPLHIDGAVRQCYIHRSATLQELDKMLKEYDMKEIQ